MKKQEFILNGSKISNKHSFFKEISETIFPDFEWKNGYSFDVLADILEGGYGLIDYQEKYAIRWQNFNNSARKMDKQLLDEVLKILNDEENIELILE
jgi:RNAse (barnase) inhibitor barstar